MRVLLQPFFGGWNSRFLEQTDCTLPRFGGIDREVSLDRLDQLSADGVERVERSQGILENCPDRAAAHLAHRLVRQRVDASAVEVDLARGDPAGRIEQTDDGR